MHCLAQRLWKFGVFVSLTSTACLPYSVGSTAATVPPGAASRLTSFSYVGSAGSLRKQGDGWLPMLDVEMRTGLDMRSDVGYRVTSMSGLVMSYKRRLIGEGLSGGLSAQAEGGFVNLGSHAVGGLSLVASSTDWNAESVYGGVRLLAVAPMSKDAVRDTPTAGGFLGMRLGEGAVQLFPEIGVFHDRSALKVRDSEWIVVPTFALRVTRTARRRVAPELPRRGPRSRDERRRGLTVRANPD